MEEFGRLSELIEALYDAASGDGSFSNLAPQIAEVFDSGSCVLHVRNGFAGTIETLTTTRNYSAEFLAAYLDYYYQHDVWANLGLQSPPGTILGSDDLPMTEAEFRETLIYRDQLRFAGAFHLLGAIVPIGGPDGAFGVFGIHRGETAQMFGPEEKRRGRLLLPHLKRALQLRERLGRMQLERETLLQAVESMAIGVLLAGKDGRILFANDAAETMLRKGDGLRVLNLCLHSTSAVHDVQLQRMIREAAAAGAGRPGEPGGLLRLPRMAGRPLGLSIYPFAMPQVAGGGEVAAALIFASDLGQRRAPTREALGQMYQLTGAESRLFESLLTGERLQDYAERSSLSLHTVKTQLAKLFAKTGHSRQTDLVREGLGNPLLGLRRD